MTAARLGWGRRGASITYGKLARALPYPRWQRRLSESPRPHRATAGLSHRIA